VSFDEPLVVVGVREDLDGSAGSCGGVVGSRPEVPVFECASSVRHAR
jgi:hypothetical protein